MLIGTSVWTETGPTMRGPRRVGRDCGRQGLFCRVDGRRQPRSQGRRRAVRGFLDVIRARTLGRRRAVRYWRWAGLVWAMGREVMVARMAGEDAPLLWSRLGQARTLGGGLLRCDDRERFNKGREAQ